jgi:hypothetical protein
VKTTLAISLLVCAAACVASTVTAASTPRVSIADLPEAQLPASPALESRPASIPASSTLSELHVDLQPGAVPVPSRGLSSFARKGGAAQQAAAPSPPQQVSVGGLVPDACLSVVANGREAFRTSQVFLDSSEGVLPVRVETIKESAQGAELDVLDAWVDPSTRGVKEIKRTVIPLKKAASGPIGASAYAFRSGTTVSLIMPAGMNAQLVDSEGRFLSTSCQIARGELKVERGKGSTLSGLFTRMTVAQDAKDGLAAVPSMAIRIALSASASQLSADPDPILSVQLRALDEIPKALRAETAQQAINLE